MAVCLATTLDMKNVSTMVQQRYYQKGYDIKGGIDSTTVTW